MITYLRSMSRRAAVFGWLAAIAVGTAVPVVALNETKVGEQYHQELSKKYRVYKDQRVVDIGQRVSDAAGIHGVDFYAIDMGREDSANAFQIPNHVYATKTLLREFDDAGVTFILAHELGHQNGHHLAKQQKKNQTIGIGAALLGALFGVKSNSVGDYAISIAGGAMANSYSRTQETEADVFGLQVLHDLGVSYDAAAESFKKLKGKSKEDKTTNALFGSHPLLSARIDRAQSADKWLGMRQVDIFTGPVGSIAVIWPSSGDEPLPSEVQRLRRDLKDELRQGGYRLAERQAGPSDRIWTKLLRVEELDGPDSEELARVIGADYIVSAKSINKGTWTGVTVDIAGKERKAIEWDATSPSKLASKIADAARKVTR